MLKIILPSLLVLLVSPAFAQTETPADTDWGLTEVAVVKDLPVPALWKVVKDDKIVWIIGDIRLKKGVPWNHGRVERIVGGAETLYLPPRVTGGLLDVYKAAKGSELPGKQTLRDVLSAEEYQRFRAVADRYGVDTTKIERSKPMWAGWRLRQAVDARQGFVAGQTVRDLTAYAKAHKVKVRPVAVYKARAALNESINASNEQSRACMMSTLDSLDYTMAAMEAQTNAWTMGDVPQLAKIVAGRPKANCPSTVVKELSARSTTDTAAVIEQAMTGSKRNVLVLNIDMLLDENLGAELRRRGFTVAAPR